MLEIGGHCGTSTLIYSQYFHNRSKLYVYEPQRELFKLLKLNVKQNNLEKKVSLYNKGVFCYSGKGSMNATDLDGNGNGTNYIVARRYTDEKGLPCNFGGIGLGKKGEKIKLTTVDKMPHKMLLTPHPPPKRPLLILGWDFSSLNHPFPVKNFPLHALLTNTTP